MVSKELSHAESLFSQVDRLLVDAADAADGRSAIRAHTAARIATSVPDDVTHRPFELDGVDGEVVTSPYDTERRIIVFVHGGAWTYGSPEESREVAGRLSRAAHAAVWAVDYRLAPEHPFPAARDDVVTVFRALVAAGSDPREIGLFAESTGASIAIGALLVLKQEGDGLPGAVVINSPVTDLADLTAAGSAPWDSITRSVAGYLGTVDPDDPQVSPAHGDLSGLPPIMVQVGTDDPGLEQTRRFVTSLEAAGGVAEMREWDDMVHGWQTLPHIYDAGRSTSQAGDFLLQKIGPGTVPVVPS